MRVLFLCFLIAVGSIATAQRNDVPDARLVRYQYQRAIGYNPLPMIGTDFTLMASYEQRVAPKIAAQLELGYIFGSVFFGGGTETDRSASGFNIRPSVKFFVSKKNDIYLQTQLFYKLVNHRVEDWLGKDPVNGIPAYRQFQEFTYRRTVYGANFIFGVLAPVGRKNFLDFYFGLGLRRKNFSLPDEPNSVYERRGAFAAEDAAILPSLPAGVRFLFRID